MLILNTHLVTGLLASCFPHGSGADSGVGGGMADGTPAGTDILSVVNVAYSERTGELDCQNVEVFRCQKN